jgi:hypothetical protein
MGDLDICKAHESHIKAPNLSSSTNDFLWPPLVEKKSFEIFKSVSLAEVLPVAEALFKYYINGVLN